MQVGQALPPANHASLYNNVDQLIRNHNHLHHLLTIQQRLNLQIPQRSFFQRLFRSSESNKHPPTHLAINLNHNLSFILLRERRIINRPRMLKQRSRRPCSSHSSSAR